MTEVDLRRVVSDEVRRALAELAPVAPEDAAVDWVGPDEAAALLGVSRDHLRRKVDVPSYGSRRRPRYRRSELEAYLLERASRPRDRRGA